MVSNALKRPHLSFSWQYYPPLLMQTISEFSKDDVIEDDIF